jgi:hypothetical protein
MQNSLRRSNQALRDEPIAATEQAEWEMKLVRRCARYVARNDTNEDARRTTDRIGANLIYGRHWQVNMPPQRAALTVNFTKALILHKIAIMTKQDPIPVIEATQFGDAKACDLLKQVVMKWWREARMKLTLRRALLQSNSTRTCSMKVCWDPTANGGVGDVAVDIVPGWRLILDDRAETVERMEFIGHRETMRRSEAALAYPDKAERIYSNIDEKYRGTPTGTNGMPSSTMGDPWRRLSSNNASFSTIVNGKPVISAYTMQGAGRTYADNKDTVQIVEMFHRDRTMVRTREPAIDMQGTPKTHIIRDENGLPKMTQVGMEYHQDGDGSYFMLPKFQIETETVMIDRIKPKYPHWRRTTFILPDLTLVDDRPWDGPVVHALFSDGDALEGPWVKGCALDVEDMQISLNVSLSTMMDNLRMNAYRPILAGQSSNIEGNTLMVKPGQVIRVGDVAQIKPFEFPAVSSEWFQWCNFVVSNMERLIGATGIMQGEAAGRVDSAAGYDLLAEIGGSRIVECTQRMEQSIVDVIKIVVWFMQKHYTDAHAFAVSDDQGNISEESLSGGFIQGAFNFNVVTGSTMAWSESAVRGRLMGELQAGIIDKIAYWQRTNTPDWQQIMKRVLSQPPVLSGGAGAPPPRTRTSSKNATTGKQITHTG